MALQGFGEEVAVISDELLLRVVAEQAPPSAKAHGKDSGMNDKDICSLRLDFQNILRIDNLFSFTSLTKLQLDNNLIERIENLECLVNLTWLDLSFNNIEKIEGLDALTKLTDLSLRHNHISKIENLDTLTQLDCLSLGDNSLQSLEDAPLLYLRRFKKLRSLALAGNKLCSEPQYETACLGYLPTLKYLDYMRITDEARDSAMVQVQDRLEVIQAKELEEEKQKQDTDAEAARIERYEEGCVADMFGSVLFERMQDEETKLLAHIPGIDEVVEAFKTTFNTKIDAMGQAGLEQLSKRESEYKEFQEAIDAGVEENRKTGAALVDAFFVEKMKLVGDDFRGAQASSRLEMLRDELEELKIKLMGLEIDLVGLIEDAVTQFERNYADLVQGFVEHINATMTDVREAEEQWYKETTDISVAYYEKLTKGEVEGALDLPDSLMRLLQEKSALTNAINSAHDGHQVAIDTKEDDIIAGLNKEQEDLIESLQEDESDRNRARVTEIANLYKFQFEEVERLLEDC